MPIKLPKGLKNRRKSSSPALEELENLPQGQGTFRVVERANGAGKSIDGGFAGGRKLASEVGRPLSYGPNAFARDEPYATVEDAENPVGYVREKRSRELFDNWRKSGITVESFSTGPANNSAASSMRLSSASTVPSSTDLPLDSQRAGVPRKPIPEPNSTQRPAGPPEKHSTSASRLHPIRLDSEASSPNAWMPTVRERAMTTSSASTATPPKLPESELALGSDMDDFSNMFDSLPPHGRRPANEPGLPGRGSPSDAVSDSSSPVNKVEEGVVRRQQILSPIMIDRTRNIESSPFSWTSHHSDDKLIGSSSPIFERSSPVQRMSIGRRSVQFSRTYSSGVGDESSIRRTPSPLKEMSAWDSEKENRGWSTTAVHGGRQLESPKEKSGNPTAVGVRQSLDGHLRPANENYSGKEKADAESVEESHFDPLLVESAHLAAKLEYHEPVKKPVHESRRVMTPAQFERYKREQESKDDSDEEDSDHGNEQEEEDEVERTKEAMKQRRRQEARLSVYRQQMMKVTGEKSEDRPVSSERPGSSRASQSEPDLRPRLSTTHLETRRSPASRHSDVEEEADEDVPLGILAAHGFPNKNRPPSALSNFRSSSGLSVRSESQVNLADPSRASFGASTPETQGSLPAFARKLPQDPYFGAGLVNPMKRESLSLGGGAPSVRGMTPPGLHPAGLVGVIAGEERARALRRGSPNVQASPELPASMQPQSIVGAMPGIPPFGGMAPPMLSPNDQAQLQMQAQMGQMMQMQMQWMHQMQLMMQGQAGGNQTTPPNLAPSPSMANLSATFRQQQQAQQPGAQQSASRGQRAKSMMDPQLPAWNRSSSGLGQLAGLGGGLSAPTSYAPSIAPSERSNLGMAPRYRPVSLGPPSHANRSATMTSSVPRSMPQQQPSKPAHTNITVRTVADEDEDECAWAEMKRQRDAKRQARRNKRGQQELAALYHG